MVEAARISAVVPPSMVAAALLPESSLVVIVTAPVNALLSVSRAIVALFALVMKEEAPVIASAPLSDIFPVAAVAVRLPPTVDSPRSKPDASTTVA